MRGRMYLVSPLLELIRCAVENDRKHDDLDTPTELSSDPRSFSTHMN